MFFRFFQIVFVCTLLVSSNVLASLQISWDSPDFQLDSNGAPITVTNLTSTGAPLDSNFFFAIGGFSAGFDPATEAPGTWAENFSVHGVARYDTSEFGPPAPAGFTRNNFTGRRFLLTNDELPLGSPVYLWGFNLDPVTLESSEWILMRSPIWVWEDSEGSTGGDLGIYSVTGDANDYPTGEAVAAVPGYGFVRTSGIGEEALMTTAAVTPGLAIPRITYSQWQDAYFRPAQPDIPRLADGRDDDRDSDGITNFQEFIAGLDPTAAQPAGFNPPSFQQNFVEVAGENFFEGSIVRSPFASATWMIEQSTTLRPNSWSNLEDSTPSPTVTATPSQLTVRSGLSAEADTGSRFFRLRIEE